MKMDAMDAHFKDARETLSEIQNWLEDNNHCHLADMINQSYSLVKQVEDALSAN